MHKKEPRRRTTHTWSIDLAEAPKQFNVKRIVFLMNGSETTGYLLKTKNLTSTSCQHKI